MHQAFLVGNIDGIHLHVRIVVHAAQILNMHVICGSDEELFLLLLGIGSVRWIGACPIVLLLLLKLHVTVLVFAVRKRVIQTLSMIPCLLCILLRIGTLCTRSLG